MDIVHDEETERFSKLGFKPQKENVYNKLLPYASDIDAESVALLATIKANLGRSVLMREMKPGCGFWSSRLMRYIKMYGLKFSRDDHLALVKLMYELVTLPHLEPWLISNFATTLTMLLKKKDLISPSDLILPWRPLYELLDGITCNSTGTLGMHRFPNSLECTLAGLVQTSRVYFPPEATAEMLVEWRPMLCPFDTKAMCRAVERLELFLPTPDNGQHHLQWFSELMDLWQQCSNATIWEPDIMCLMARLAGQKIGAIDWEPHMALMFTRFQRSLNLPVAYKQLPAVKAHRLESGPVALWIVSVLGGGSSAQRYLDKFMTVIESYYHPANFGRWLMKLKELLRKLPYYFVQRVHLERHKRLTWQRPVPESHRLSDADITAFVDSMKGVAMQAMFSKLGATEASQAMQHLATLRPDIIVPLVLDRVNSNLSVLTEPHKLTAALQCAVGVARPLVRGAYKEHVMPLLQAVLPGIDPNDLKKCFVTFQLISTFVTMVPVVDCSDAALHYTDLTESESVVCLATAELEDFVLQFLERCFSLVESSSLESTRLEQSDSDTRSKLENMAEGGLASTCTSLLMQTSPQIFKSALRKLHTFVSTHILETSVAGHFVAAMCRSFARAGPEDTLRLLVPHLCSTIEALTESDEVLMEERLDNELLYNMLLLAEVVDCKHSALLRYCPALTAVLDRTLHLRCRQGQRLAARLLGAILGCLSNIAPLEYRSVSRPYDQPTSNYLPVRDWGICGDLDALKLQWQVPSEAHVQEVQRLVDRYLDPELQRITQFLGDRADFTRDELLCSLLIVIALLNCKTLLPIWDEEPLNLWERTMSGLQASECSRYGQVTASDGGNVRKTVADVMEQLQAKLLASREDDTKAFFALIKIWECLLLNRVGSRNGFQSHWKSFHMVKKVLEDKLVGGKKHLRALLIDRAVLQHEQLTAHSWESLTQTHSSIMLQLLTLSCSHYSEVRTQAQARLFEAVEKFPYSYTVLVPQLQRNLQQDSNKHHELFKGSLYVLLGPKQSPLLTKHDWGLLNTLWPAVVKARPSEKLSVVRILETLVDTVHKHFPTITISLQIPDSCLSCAKQLWLSAPAPLVPLSSEADIALGLAQRNLTNATNHSEYLALLGQLMDAVEHDNLHWRYRNMAMSFIRDLVHPNLAYPARIVSGFLQALVSDSLELRKIGIKGTVFCLKQQKRPHKRVSVDPFSISKVVRPDQVLPGIRPDNLWLCYDQANWPLNAEQWDQPRFLHKPYHGYYTWPSRLEVYAPYAEQPCVERTREEMTEEERSVDQFFSVADNVDRLLGFLAMEEKKGKDKFNGFRFIMFKSLFRNHGDTYLPLFAGHLQRLVSEKHESSQRCAAEIIAGLIRGSKHWPYDKAVALRNLVTPLVTTALCSMTVETMPDWGICFATAAEDRDPNRQAWLMELLMTEPLREDASFIACGRLYTLQGAANQQQWRLQRLFQRLLDYFRPNLTHTFQNVRERIASMLVNVFETDVTLGGGNGTGSPRVSDFIDYVLPQLAVLYKIGASDVRVSSPVGVTDLSGPMQNVRLGDEERDVAIRLMKTVCRYVSGAVSRSQHGVWPAFYCLVPLAAHVSGYEGDDELGKTCSATLAALSQALVQPDSVHHALNTLARVAQAPSWSARLVALDFLQVFTFHNMPTLCASTQHVHKVNEIVLSLLADVWLDVREKAAQVLSGLIHCHFMQDTDTLLVELKTRSRTALPRDRTHASCIGLVRLRHSGVLGLCAFVNAYPYEVPDFVPDIFSQLGSHLNDPQPIPSTIRKTLGDFKRTHHDNWPEHSLKFTEEQLAVLGDLVLPPSYYA